jgi:hypothetical protein
MDEGTRPADARPIAEPVLAKIRAMLYQSSGGLWGSPGTKEDSIEEAAASDRAMEEMRELIARSEDFGSNHGV